MQRKRRGSRVGWKRKDTQDKMTEVGTLKIIKINLSYIYRSKKENDKIHKQNPKWIPELGVEL
jgi:hypothetical protein